MSEDARDAIIRFIDEKYGLLVFKIANGILRDESLADDVKQEVLIKCIPKTDILAKMEPKQLTAYIATAVRNTAISELRKKASQDALQKKLIEERNRYATMDHVDFKAFEDRYGFSEEVWELLNELSPMDRDIMVLRFHYRCTNPEIADMLGGNTEQIKKRYQRARKRLIELIEEKGVELL